MDRGQLTGTPALGSSAVLFSHGDPASGAWVSGLSLLPHRVNACTLLALRPVALGQVAVLEGGKLSPEPTETPGEFMT